MDLAKKMREQEKQSLIVFITSASEYVFEAFDVETFGYLVKPIQHDKLKNTLEKAIKKCRRIKIQISSSYYQTVKQKRYF